MVRTRHDLRAPRHHMNRLHGTHQPLPGYKWPHPDYHPYIAFSSRTGWPGSTCWMVHTPVRGEIAGPGGGNFPGFKKFQGHYGISSGFITRTVVNTQVLHYNSFTTMVEQNLDLGHCPICFEKSTKLETDPTGQQRWHWIPATTNFFQRAFREEHGFNPARCRCSLALMEQILFIRQNLKTWFSGSHIYPISIKDGMRDPANM